MGFIEKLKSRWKLKSVTDVLLVLLVFAATGTTVIIIRRVLKANFEWAHHKWFTYTYYWLILPFYNIILLLYGTLVGKGKFFWEFEKRFFARIVSIFKKKSE